MSRFSRMGKRTKMQKQLVIQHIQQLLVDKQRHLSESIDDLNNAIANETKSSAGDKYETSRAMAQQEIDQLSNQLEENKRQTALLSGLTNSTGKSIQMGSLVQTTLGWFFIGIPVGKIVIQTPNTESKTIQCISSIAPFSQQLMQKKEGEKVTINGIIHEIQTVKNA